jgi:alanyl-tRNA synthetase
MEVIMPEYVGDISIRYLKRDDDTLEVNHGLLAQCEIDSLRAEVQSLRLERDEARELLRIALLAGQKELEKALKAARAKEAAAQAKDLAAKSESLNGIPCLIANLGAVDGDYLQAVLDALKQSFDGITVLAGSANSAVSLVSSVSATHTSKFQAGKIIQTIAPIVGGKGGGKPDSARGGGKDTSKISEALAAAKNMLGAV